MAELKIWYLFIEGETVKKVNALDGDKGFFVDCLVLSDSEKTVKNLVKKSLSADGLKLLNIEEIGEFKDFDWEDEEHWKELSKIASELKKESEIGYSIFNCWLKKANHNSFL